MNVTELARRLKVPTKELLRKLPELGFHVGHNAIKVNDRLVPKIIETFEIDQKRNREAIEQAKVREIRKEMRKKGQEIVFEKVIEIPQKINVKDFATVLNITVPKVMGELMLNGVMASLNEEIDFDIATIVAENFGYGTRLIDTKEKKENLEEIAAKKMDAIKIQDLEKGIVRPPVIVVMGHVDHGKTSLLDAIRETHVASGESGGITQSIGAYQIVKNDRVITFLDTPGHEAFKAMRSRGGRVADIAILLVAADDGLQPQTLESVEVIQKTGLPFVVAINKMDKPGVDIDRVKAQLSEINLTPEDWGGKTICVPVSAKTKMNLEVLLDTVLLVADMQEFRADADKDAAGTIIESHNDKSEGPVATLLVQTGTLRKGDFIRVGDVIGSVRVMKDSLGKELTEALPSTPVKILGLKNIPNVGELLEATRDEKLFREWKKTVGNKKKIIRTGENVSQSNSTQEEDDKQTKLNVIVKADVFGSVEAIVSSLKKMDTQNVIRIIKQGLGNINDSDVLAAESSHAIVVGFKVNQDREVALLVRDKKVDVMIFDVIYKLFDYVKAKAEALLIEEVVRRETGKMRVLAIFRSEKKHLVLGGKMIDGSASSPCKVKVLDNKGELVGWGDVEEIRAGKEVVTHIVEGQECGLKLKFSHPVAEGYILEFFAEEILKKVM